MDIHSSHDAKIEVCAAIRRSRALCTQRSKTNVDWALSIPNDEGHIIQACTRKEAWAMKIVYEEYYSPMMNILVRYAGSPDQASDWVHDGFIKVFQNLHAFKVGTSLHAWIKRIMVNTAIDNLRKAKIRRTQDLSQMREYNALDPQIISQLSQEEILQEIQRLPPSYRLVFNLYVLEGYNHNEISSAIGISPGTSRSNLTRARRTLQEALAQRIKSHESE